MRKLFERKKTIKKSSPESLLMDIEHHEWIRAEKLYYRFFKDILSQIDSEAFQRMNNSREICFLYSDGLYASTLPNDSSYSFIIVYPELLKLIRSVDNSHAAAIIFHEFGHIYSEDHKSNKSQLEKEITADLFATYYGHGPALLDFLNSKKRTFEIVKRIETITKELENSH